MSRVERAGITGRTKAILHIFQGPSSAAIGFNEKCDQLAKLGFNRNPNILTQTIKNGPYLELFRPWKQIDIEFLRLYLFVKINGLELLDSDLQKYAKSREI